LKGAGDGPLKGKMGKRGSTKRGGGRGLNHFIERTSAKKKKRAGAKCNFGKASRVESAKERGKRDGRVLKQRETSGGSLRKCCWLVKKPRTESQ